MKKKLRISTPMHGGGKGGDLAAADRDSEHCDQVEAAETGWLGNGVE